MSARSTSDTLRAAVKHMLNDSRYRTGAERLARAIQADKGEDRAVQELERLAPAAVLH